MTKGENLRIDVIDELNNAPSLVGRHIEVGVRMGMVSMMGHVESIDERNAADSAAARIVGPPRIARGFGVQREQSELLSGWVQEVRSSLEHDPNNIHRTLKRDQHKTS